MDAASLSEIESTPTLTYRFGPYMLDVGRRRLLQGSDVKILPEKILQVLVMLLEAKCRVVERQEFFECLWPDEPVGDATLTQHIFVLRGLLSSSDRANNFVVTVPGKGYRFALPAEAKLGLTMKGSCESCGRMLGLTADAYICSYECTFCPSCTDALKGLCPNCGGEQTPRPKRDGQLN